MANIPVSPTHRDERLTTTQPRITIGFPFRLAPTPAFIQLTEADEVKAVVNGILDALATTVSSLAGEAGGKARRQIGDVRANYLAMLNDQTFATNLLACYTIIRESGATILSMAIMLEKLFASPPLSSHISIGILQIAIVFNLSTQSRMWTSFVFKSRDEVDQAIKGMQKSFERAREMAADAMDSQTYQDIVTLYAALMQHLETTARPLPRMIKFPMPLSWPVYRVSNLVYQDVTRSQEIVDENAIVHPAFCPRDLRGLSA